MTTEINEYYMVEPIAKIEPLINDLKELSLGDFLKSNEFKRYLIRAGLEESWKNAFNHAKQSRGYFSFGMDHDYFDSIDAMILVLNHFYSNSRDNFYSFIYDLLQEYTEWKNTDLNVKTIVEDLNLLSPPREIINKIENLGNYYSNPVPKSEIPDDIWNAEKLDSFLSKMDSSIQNKEYNLTVTYAYSCLEGLFKTYINEVCPDCAESDKLNVMAKQVRDNIINKFDDAGVNYPEQIINLIPTITNAVSSARNSFSDSHFDRESDKWLAEFAKDSVNTIGRLILELIKNNYA